MQIGVEQPELMVQAMAAHNTLTDCLMNDGSDDDGSLVEKIREDFVSYFLELEVEESGECKTRYTECVILRHII